MRIVVDSEDGVIEPVGSIQFTTVPFKPMLTESKDNEETRGEAP